ncbi:hypothetical protein [Engelhardtia mirabilis]|uniref:Uncharacterized protein n=1 Tax=Engelhardtia mirabilis TaxID=2528011 RepID=A0A518BIZ4_9BACT|nr:hypothetical protein Pla133_20140 [Planctomycetes bacterium Pla133]QDV01266.1 hypothetical protein Pla86_20150 [Planctomycetes bacterium Pla86]
MSEDGSRTDRPKRVALSARPLWGLIVALVLAVGLSWPLAVSGAGSVQAHPLGESSATASGHVLAWGLWSAGGPSGPFVERRVASPGGVFLGDGEHGAVWRLVGSELASIVGVHQAANLLTLSILMASGVLAYLVARRLRLSRIQSILAAVLWVASPALIERGLASHAGLAPPTVPAAALLAAALVRLRRPLAAAMALGVVGAFAAAAGEGTALAAALAAAAGAWFARPAMPRVTGGPTVVALGLTLALSTTLAAALWLDWARDEALGSAAGPDAVALVDGPAESPGVGGGWPSSALPERIGSAPIDRRPIAGPSPFHPLTRLLVTGHPEGGTGQPAERKRPAPALGLAAILLGAVVVLRVPTWRRPAIVGLVALSVAALARSLWLEAAVLPLATLTMALVAARGVAAIRSRPIAMAIGGLALLEAVALPWPLQRWAPSSNLEQLAASPVPGAILDLPVRAGSQAAHSRQVIHQRSTPLALFPERSGGSLEALVRRAPSVGHLLLGQVPPEPEQLAAELEWVGVGHLMAEKGALLPAMVDALDALPGWERAPDDAVVHWWYRTRGLWTADAHDMNPSVSAAR